MTTYPHIDRYHEELAQLIEFGGSDNEQSIRRAFESCLTAYCREHKERVVLVAELPLPSGVRPDGTVKDSLRMARGYWEAKDTHDNLDAEIQHKFSIGYPKGNIIFEDSKTAVLIQNGNEAMRVDMTRPGEVDRLIRTFLDYELPQIQEFRKAQTQFKDDLPTVLDNLRATVAQAEADNPGYQQAAAAFLDLCRNSIGPNVSPADVREMLLQHILTKDIFLRVFGESQFHRENNVAARLDALEQTFFTGDVRRQAIDRLRAYYGVIGRAADEIADHAEKQQFLKAIYEDFYKAYNPAAADRLGVVYTPNEIVDFIIRGADHLLQRHFGRRLADPNVGDPRPSHRHRHLCDKPHRLPGQTGEPTPSNAWSTSTSTRSTPTRSPSCPTTSPTSTSSTPTGSARADTWSSPTCASSTPWTTWTGRKAGATGGAVTRQSAFNLGAVSTENWMRVQLQNEKTISVIIGNPPYNANQQNENDKNKNREYPEIDRRIRETTSKPARPRRPSSTTCTSASSAGPPTAWPTTESLPSSQIGLTLKPARMMVSEMLLPRSLHPSIFWIWDQMSGATLRSPGTVHNVFGIQTGVSIAFLVRERGKLGECAIHYARREDTEIAMDKLAYLRDTALESVPFESVTPDAESNWLNQSTSNFARLLPLANKETKLAKNTSEERRCSDCTLLGQHQS